jgi:hypothetical protein
MDDVRVVIFYSMAEYCDHSAKLTLKLFKNQIRWEHWTSNHVDQPLIVRTASYKTNKKAYEEFERQIGKCILGGWHVLNAFPQRETWETKRSK